MASLKTDKKLIKRSMINTTINEEILKKFKGRCKEIGTPMNMLIETFMRQFADGEFGLKLYKNNLEIIDTDGNDE